MVLSIPATLGLMGLLERTGAAGFSLIGGSLVIIGVIFLTLFIGVELAMSAIALGGPLPVVFVGLSLNLGLFVLGVGLLSMQAVARWTGVAIEIAAVVLVGGLFSNPMGLVGAAVLGVGLGAIGLRVLKSVRYTQG